MQRRLRLNGVCAGGWVHLVRLGSTEYGVNPAERARAAILSTILKATCGTICHAEEHENGSCELRPFLGFAAPNASRRSQCHVPS